MAFTVVHLRQYIDVSEEVADKLWPSRLYGVAYYRRISRNKAQHFLDCEDRIEFSAREERRNVEAHILDEKKLKDVAGAEGVTLKAVSDSALRDLANT